MPVKITAGPGGKLNAVEIKIPINVMINPKIMLKTKNDFKLQAKLRAETAGKIVRAPIKTEPISLMPKATLNAKSSKNAR